ncbi:MAG: glycogen synthase GlgA [Polyangiales bacterium]
MRVVHVSAEVAPFAQSGGLADVVSGLPAAQAEVHGLDVGVIVPLYRGVEARLRDAGITLEAGVPLSLELGVHDLEGALRIAKVGRVRYGFVDLPALYDRPGNLYGPGGAGEWNDNHVRFAALGMAAIAAAPALLGGAPDVVHAHDWQGGPAAIYARLAPKPPAIVTTIHNLAYRGIFPKPVMNELGLPWSLFTQQHLEFYDQVSFLKGGLAAADVVTTVSPSYAQEILTPPFGEALDGFLRWDIKRLVGIVNGIDARAWDPGRDALAKRSAIRAALAAEMELPLVDDEPLIGVIARMTGQKGLDLVAEIVPDLEALGARMVVLGAGQPDLEDRFRTLALLHPTRLAARIGFDLGLARRIYGGTDLFVMPSRFEPCGLGQLYAMRFGSIPVVRAVGGLRDTVTDGVTGIQFVGADAASLRAALLRAVALYRDRDAFSSLQRNAMARDSSWNASALDYVQLYRSLRA